MKTSTKIPSKTLMLRTAGWSVLAGGRSMSAPAMLAERYPLGLGQFEPELVKRALRIMAAGEMIVDKFSFTPDRTSPLPLMGRAVSGGLIGVAIAETDDERLASALIGASVAVAATFAFFALRSFVTRRLKVPNLLAGMMEDAAIVAIGHRLIQADLSRDSRRSTLH